MRVLSAINSDGSGASVLQLRIERRRRALAVLVGTTLFFVVFGALPHLHLLWDLAATGFVLDGDLRRAVGENRSSRGCRRRVKRLSRSPPRSSTSRAKQS